MFGWCLKLEPCIIHLFPRIKAINVSDRSYSNRDEMHASLMVPSCLLVWLLDPLLYPFTYLWQSLVTLFMKQEKWKEDPSMWGFHVGLGQVPRLPERESELRFNIPRIEEKVAWRGNGGEKERRLHDFGPWPTLWIFSLFLPGSVRARIFNTSANRGRAAPSGRFYRSRRGSAGWPVGCPVKQPGWPPAVTTWENRVRRFAAAVARRSPHDGTADGPRNRIMPSHSPYSISLNICILIWLIYVY